MRSIITVGIEALIISLILLAIHRFFLLLLDDNLLTFFFAGFMTHFLFEFSPFGNLNEKWCNKVFK